MKKIPLYDIPDFPLESEESRVTELKVLLDSIGIVYSEDFVLDLEKIYVSYKGSLESEQKIEPQKNIRDQLTQLRTRAFLTVEDLSKLQNDIPIKMLILRGTAELGLSDKFDIFKDYDQLMTQLVALGTSIEESIKMLAVKPGIKNEESPEILASMVYALFTKHDLKISLTGHTNIEGKGANFIRLLVGLDQLATGVKTEKDFGRICKRLGFTKKQ